MQRPFVVLFAALGLAGCQVAPGTGSASLNMVSAQEEQKMGAEAHPSILKEFGGAYDDPQMQAYVAGIGQRLVRQSETPNAEFRFTVLNSTIFNAMALPGGYVYVTRGLIAVAGNEAELAGVIGHEIGHVTAQHTGQRYTRTMAANVLTTVLGVVVGVPGVGEVASLGAGAYLQGFSRDNESEADALGMRYMAKAGYDPHAMSSMFTRMRDHSRLEALLAGRSPEAVDEFHMMASHPRAIERVQATAEAVRNEHPHGALGTEQYLTRLDGMVYGDDPKEGVVRNRSFMHPSLGIGFEVPPGFRLVNGAKAVTANHSDGSLIRFDMGRDAHAGPASYLRHQWAKGLKLSEIETIEVNGLPAAIAATRVDTRKGSLDARLLAIQHGDQVWRFMFLTPPNVTAQHIEEFKRSTYSFHRLSEAEKSAVRPLRVKVVAAKPGDTVEKLAARLPFDRFQLERFQALNGLHPGDVLKPGQPIKLVE
jgi:predicted Zn-dependent protease